MPRSLEVQQPSLRSTRIVVNRWQDGDGDALSSLVERFTPLLCHRIQHRPAYHSVRTLCSVDDLVQEIWAQVLDAGPDSFTHNGKGSFVAWLGQIADRTLIDQCRRKATKKRGDGDLPGQLDSVAEKHARQLPGGGNAATPTGEARLSEFEAAAAKVLDEREQLAWRWVAIEGYTSEEAAMGLGVTSSAVRGMLARSRQKLRTLLEERRQVE